MITRSREAIGSFVRIQDEMLKGCEASPLDSWAAVYQRLKSIVAAPVGDLAPAERTIVAAFCRVQDDNLRMHPSTDVIPGLWLQAYYAVRDLVSEEEIAAQSTPFIAIGAEEIAAFVREDPRGAAVQRTILEIKRDHKDDE